MKIEHDLDELAKIVEAMESYFLEEIRKLQDQVKFLEEHIDLLDSRLKNMRNEG